MPVTAKELWAASGQQAAQAPQNEPHPADGDYTPPVTTVKLPSKGVTYPPESALYMCEALDVRAMTAKEEDILSSPALIKRGTVLSTLMRACITNRLVDPDQMLVGDRNAVLIAIRVSAYGAEYPATVACPDCEETHERTFNLSRLTLKTIDVEPAGGPGTNEFSFRLDRIGKEVRFKLMDAATASKLDRDAESIRKKGGQESGVTMRLLAQVISIEGVEPRMLPKAIAAMPAGDSRSLRAYIDEISPGVDMVQEAECPACGASREVEIPLGTEFFWPSST